MRMTDENETHWFIIVLLLVNQLFSATAAAPYKT